MSQAIIITPFIFLNNLQLKVVEYSLNINIQFYLFLAYHTPYFIYILSFFLSYSK